MTDNLPARRPAEVATTDTDSWIDVMGPVVNLSKHIAGTEFVPRNLRDKPAAVAAALLFGREVGLPPMTALTMTHVVEGKPAMSAEGQRALILAAGHEIEVVETNGARCIMRARRRGSETWTHLEWSLDMARAAGLLSKGVWKAYPRAMLQARCTAELARLVFPDVIHGFRAVEELDEDPAEGRTGFEAPAETTTTKVRRTGRTRKSTPPAVEAAPSPGAVPVVALPGEAGFEDLAAGVPVAGEEGTAAPEPVAEPVEAPAEPAPAEPVEDQEDDPGDVVEADVVEDQETTDQAEPERKASRAQLRMILPLFKGLGLATDDERDERLRLVSQIVGRPVESTSDLSVSEASAVIDTVSRAQTLSDLWAIVENLGETP